MPAPIPLPWRCKLAAKLVLGHLPVTHQVWKRVRLFEHGLMHDPAYAYAVFDHHCQRAGAAARPADFVALELGPGDSLFSALLGKAFGASRTYLVDTGAYATAAVAHYAAMDAYLQARRGGAPLLAAPQSLAQVMEQCDATYLTEGLRSLQSLPDRSVDFIYSHAVLEHVRKDVVLPTLRELRRILRRGGRSSHRVDLRDHLGGGLNNLRFSERLWESEFFARAGFYTNRIPYSGMLACFREAGFHIEVAAAERRPPPIRRSQLAADCRAASDDDLCVWGFDAVLAVGN